MLDKEIYIRASESQSATDEHRCTYELMVGLIEIREAIQVHEHRCTHELMVGLVEIREAIQANTEVQRRILDKGVDAEKAFAEVAEMLPHLSGEIDHMRTTMKMHAELIAAIAEVQTQHAETLLQIAEGKQSTAGRVETRALLPDAG